MATWTARPGKKGISYQFQCYSGSLDGKPVRHTKTWKPDPGMTQRQIEKMLPKIAAEFEREITAGFDVANKQAFPNFQSATTFRHCTRTCSVTLWPHC